MENLTCVFCGHRDAPESLYTMVYHTAEELIVRQGVTQFYCGGKGAFDRIAARAVYNLKARYPHIRSCQVLAYLPEKFDSASDDLFDETIYPEGFIAIAVSLDDYGNLLNPEYYPKVGDTIRNGDADRRVLL